MSIFDMILPLGEDKFEKEISRLQALTAQELMAIHLKTVTLDTGLDELATIMSESNIHHLPVIQEQVVEGVISKHDLIRALAMRKA